MKELKKFERLYLKAGEKKTVTFTLPVEDLAFYNLEMKKTVEPGDFRLWVGTNSQEGLSVDFEITNE